MIPLHERVIYTAGQVVGRYGRQLKGFTPNARFFLLTTIILGLGFSINQLFFNLYVDASGYSREFLGQLQSIPNLVALLGAIPAGSLVDAIGRKRAMLLSNVIRTAGTLGIILARDPLWLFISVTTFGVSQALWMVCAAPFMMENSTSQERNALFSANFGLQTLVGFAGTLAGGYLPTLFGRLMGVGVESAPAYAATLGISVAMSLLSLLPVFMIHEQPRAALDVQPRSLLPWRNISNPKLVGQIFVPNIVISMGAAILIPYMNLFFKETFDISDKLLGLLFAISAIVTGTATLASPALADRWGRIRSLVATQLASIPFLLIIGFVPAFWLAGLAFWVRAALMNMGNPLYSAFAMEQVDERERATVSGLMGMSWTLGWTVGPFVSGYMQAAPSIGFKPIFIITCALYVLASILAHRFFQKLDDEQRSAAARRGRGTGG